MLLDEPQKYTCTITSDCTCEVYNEETDSVELDEYGDPKRPDYCYGDCYTDSIQDFTDNFLPMWLEKVGASLDDKLLVVATRIGWDNSSGAGYITAREAYKAMELNGDFRNVFTIENDELYAIRYSHDEPVGSGRWTFSPTKPCDKCGEPLSPDIHAEELGMCVECSNKYFDHEHPEHDCPSC